MEWALKGLEFCLTIMLSHSFMYILTQSLFINVCAQQGLIKISTISCASLFSATNFPREHFQKHSLTSLFAYQEKYTTSWLKSSLIILCPFLCYHQSNLYISTPKQHFAFAIFIVLRKEYVFPYLYIYFPSLKQEEP